MSVFLYKSECSTLMKEQMTRMEKAEMSFRITVAGWRLDS